MSNNEKVQEIIQLSKQEFEQHLANLLGDYLTDKNKSIILSGVAHEWIKEHLLK